MWFTTYVTQKESTGVRRGMVWVRGTWGKQGEQGVPFCVPQRTYVPWYLLPSPSAWPCLLLLGLRGARSSPTLASLRWTCTLMPLASCPIPVSTSGRLPRWRPLLTGPGRLSLERTELRWLWSVSVFLR